MDVDNFKSDISIKAKASTKENAKTKPPKTPNLTGYCI